MLKIRSIAILACCFALAISSCRDEDPVEPATTPTTTTGNSFYRNYYFNGQTWVVIQYVDDITNDTFPPDTAVVFDTIHFIDSTRYVWNTDTGTYVANGNIQSSSLGMRFDVSPFGMINHGSGSIEPPAFDLTGYANDRLFTGANRMVRLWFHRL